VLAKKIIGHRDRYGPFRRPEDILIIDGISEKRFREFRGFILIK
jgi:DNA uptake protein and related DNA-binding proteins